MTTSFDYRKFSVPGRSRGRAKKPETILKRFIMCQKQEQSSRKFFVLYGNFPTNSHRLKVCPEALSHLGQSARRFDLIEEILLLIIIPSAEELKRIEPSAHSLKALCEWAPPKAEVEPIERADHNQPRMLRRVPVP
jgi:hypothetical protein